MKTEIKDFQVRYILSEAELAERDARNAREERWQRVNQILDFQVFALAVFAVAAIILISFLHALELSNENQLERARIESARVEQRAKAEKFADLLRASGATVTVKSE
jgi:hypothetical protein